MALYQNDDLEFMFDNYMEMDDFDSDDDLSEEDQRRGSSDGDLDNYVDDTDDFELSKQKYDTSALDARNGKDIQGIPWERMNFTRDKYRETRLKQYKNYASLSYSSGELDKECKQVEKGNAFYDFQFNTRLVKSTIVHFQLRNLLWATSKHDVYLMHSYSVIHWSPLLRRSKEVLNVAGRILPIIVCSLYHRTSYYLDLCFLVIFLKRKDLVSFSLKEPRGSQAQSLSRVQVSTMAVKDNLMAAGGFQGELICKHLNRPDVAFCSKITTDENAITNAVDIYRSPNGSTQLMTANNDCHVRVFDMENFTVRSQFSFPWSVNNTSVSPDGKLLAILGDSADCLLADAQSGKAIGNLKGHLDYSFSSAWHPSGNVLATGNQDTTCRLWDVRKLSESFCVLKGRMAAIRAIKFTSDGKYMAMAEPADFVHIFDTEADYSKAQDIDLFGEIAGISFSPDTEALFVGVADRTYGSLLEFNRRHRYQYLESYY